jgi:hypothetical protein
MIMSFNSTNWFLSNPHGVYLNASYVDDLYH